MNHSIKFIRRDKYTINIFLDRDLRGTIRQGLRGNFSMVIDGQKHSGKARDCKLQARAILSPTSI